MRCDVCPHMKRIRAALAPCQTCDAGALRGTTHPAPDKMDYAIMHQREANRAQQDGVTNLVPDDEDKLRRAMSTLFGLDPIDLLLVQHIFAGRSLASFGDTMIAVERKIRRYHGSIRAMAAAKKDAIIRIFPQIKPVFKHLIDENNMPRSNPDAIDALIDDDADRDDLRRKPPETRHRREEGARR